MRTALAALALLGCAVLADPAACKSPDKPAKTPKAAKASPSGPDSLLRASTFSGLKLRGIGPAVTSGRIIDIAIPPGDPHTWYVAVASGNVWKTSNAGTTWEPIFDDQGSYSIGCLAVDPKHPLTVWVGTGENNSQRSVGYGDGVYKSVDGGRNWAHMGLKESEHVGMIAIDPRDPNVVYVAAQGPLWREGGDRGLYRTGDGGKTWTRVLHVDDRTGVSEVRFDPRDPDVMYATAYERHRRVWTLIDGGPGSGLYKSTDAGRTWSKLTNGLPRGDIGRIGLAIPPSNPDMVYAMVEAPDTSRGIFRSDDGGANFEKVSGYCSGSPQYYQEMIPDPVNPDRVYSMDTWMMVTQDGGRTWRRVGERFKHVDNHALWIDSTDTAHMIAGCDGGLYQTFDRGATWAFCANLPVTQFYKLTVDNALPFYNVYGGTQDNYTLGGPSRTNTVSGIRNSDWFVTTGGDGFQSQVDPEDPNIVYSESQHAGIVRFDRRSGEETGIQPQPGPGEPASRWNWDSPLIISPFSHTRLYLASQRLWRSDDRGDSWKPVSPDLTRQIDRNRLKVAGRVWGVDAVAKNTSTSFYGNIVSLAESPKVEGLLFVGTDDGLVQVSEDGGGAWRAESRFPGVPDLSYVSRLVASQHDDRVVYATFDNHKTGDFKPYVLRSPDRGRTWKSVAGDLPERGTVYALAEDPVDPALLFAGTEFGVFFTADGGRRWVRLQGGMPTIAVKDLAIQKRENDLVVATFGRGFYILDDYAPLRGISAATLEKPASLFGTRTALMYVPASPLGGRAKSFQGDAFYIAPNPPFGAVLTYYLRDGLRSRREARRELEKRGGDVYYPAWDSLKAEDREEEPSITLTVTDEDGNVVRRMSGPSGRGFQRVAWDLRYPSMEPVTEGGRELAPWDQPPTGPMAAPGTYMVSMEQRVDGKVTPLAGPVRFKAEALENLSLPAKDRGAVLAFQRNVARLQRAVLGAGLAAREAQTRLSLLQRAVDQAPAAKAELREKVRALTQRLSDIQTELDGDPVKGSRNEPTVPGIRDDVSRIVGNIWNQRSETPGTDRKCYEDAAQKFAGTLEKLRTLVKTDLAALDAEAESIGAPWTPGRVPEWRP
ncbi:MAG: glycosyl hydrolase [Candidatus Eisenbacteria bacterium]|nr:glycosyl hydrolase [Candidatus Eisenbacteria bacterium]